MLPFSLTRPVAAQVADLSLLYHDVGDAVTRLTKAGAAVKTHALSGELQLSASGWGLLKVPNALVRGAFDALDEPGAELPLRDGRLNAHISVLRPEDIEQIGGAAKVKEFGHHFSYTLGPVMEVKPSGWKEVSKVWFLKVESPDLERLRRSYGLSSLPKDGKHDFHITVGLRRVHVLGHNDVAKEGHHLPRDGQYPGVQRLEGDEDPVYEPFAQAVQGLRGEGDHGLRKVGEQLHQLLRGHGSLPAGPHDRAEGEQPGVQPGELRLAAAKQAEQEPAGQSSHRIPWGNAVAGGVGRENRTAVPHNPQPSGDVGLVGREGTNDWASGVKRAAAVPVDGWRDAVSGRLGEAVREAPGLGCRSTEEGLGAAGRSDDADAGRSEGAVDRLLKLAAESRGPAAEYCPHCDARLERDPYSGTCNGCGKDWPAEKRAGYGDGDPRFGCQCPVCGGTKTSGARATQHFPDGTWDFANAHCSDCGDGFSFNYDTMKPEKRATGRRGEKHAAFVPKGGTVSYDYYCFGCKEHFDHADDGGSACPTCGKDCGWTTTNPRRQKATKRAMNDFYANGDRDYFCSDCGDGFDKHGGACPKCGKDVRYSNRILHPGLEKDAAAVLSDLLEGGG